MTLTVQKITQYTDRNQTYLYKNVSLKFEKAHFYVIVGQKDLMLFLAGCDSPSSGTVNFNGKNILKIGLNKYRSQKVSLISAENNLLDYMTPIENVMSALSITKSKHAGSKRYARDLFLKAGIESAVLKKRIADLSLPQRQLVALVRAVAVDASVILADDPTEKLDRAATDRLLTAFAAVAHKWKKTVILATEKTSIADRADVKIALRDHRFVTERNR